MISIGAMPARAEFGRERSGNMPATTRKATAPITANAANQSRSIQCGSIRSMADARGLTGNLSYSAGVANPVGCPLEAGFGVREVLRILVLTYRVSYPFNRS